jgi:hypothetical protein
VAELPELPEWVEGIYQLEMEDPVLAGPGGIDNLQASQLARRTRWLKAELAAVESRLEALEAVSGRGWEYSFVAGEPIGGHRAVWLGDDGEVRLADRMVSGHVHRVLGVSDGAAAAGDVARIIGSGGLLVEPSWEWTAGQPVWLGSAGVLGQEVPEDGVLLQVGVAVRSEALLVRVGRPIILS